MAKKEVEKQETGDQLPVIDYSAEAGSGFEEADRDSFAIPFLRILQDLSPQCKRSEAEYIEGAQAGMLFESAAKSLLQECTVIPVHYRRTFIKWAPRSAGGGFQGEYGALSQEVTSAMRDGPQLVDADGNIYQDTRLHYVLLMDGEQVRPAVIAMASTAIKRSKEWMTRMESQKLRAPSGVTYTPPMHARAWKLSTVIERKNDNSWWTWKIEPAQWIREDSLREACNNFRNAVRSGGVKEKFEEEVSAVREPGEDF